MRKKDAELLTTYVIAKLKKTRLEKGISQVALSEMAGLRRSGLGHIESARVTPSLESVFRICGALQIDLRDLLDDYDTKSSK